MRHISTKHNNYIRCALNNIKIAVNRSGKLFSMNRINKFKKIKPLHHWLLKKYSNNYAVVSDCMDTSIVMTAFCLEAFINFYAVHYEIDKMPDYNERRRTLEKWNTYPQIVTGTPISKESIVMLNTIFTARNNLAHYKSRTGQSGYSYNLKNAIDIVNYAPKIFKDLSDSHEEMIATLNYKIDIPEYAINIELGQGEYCLRDN